MKHINIKNIGPKPGGALILNVPGARIAVGFSMILVLGAIFLYWYQQQSQQPQRLA